MRDSATRVEHAEDCSTPGVNGSGAPWLRVAMRLLSPAGARARLSILIFHRVHPRQDPLFPNEMYASAFLDRMRWLKEWFNVLPLEEAVAMLARRSLPERALAVTFDDGYADNVTVALPILRQLGMHATFFVSTGFLGGGRMWNDTIIDAVRAYRGTELDLSGPGLGVHVVSSTQSRRTAIEALLAELKHRPFVDRQRLVQQVAASCDATLSPGPMMSRDQVQVLSASGMGIGAHTVTHPILAGLDAATVRREIMKGRDALEGLLRQPVRLFAYPNGKPNVDYRAAHADIVRSLGFTAAVSTAWGAARDGDSLFELPRFTPWDRTAARYGLRLARNLLVRVERANA